ncbi:MAG: DUF4286 family protein [Tannerella sp.]|nr:DUF4286 family protein [Tannerella sp.]
MKYYNVTFHLDKEMEETGIAYLQAVYIPQMLASGVLGAPLVRRVKAFPNERGLQEEEEKSCSYALQFPLSNEAAFPAFIREESVAIHAALGRKFGGRMLGFATLLEELEWK